jgi:hypothetical protein
MKIFFASSPTEAHIVCELLKSQGISCEVRGEGLFGLKGEIPFTQENDPYIWLFQHSQIDAAKHVIQDFEQQKRPSTEPIWVCENCQQENEPQFGACWQCGKISSGKV